MHAQQSPVIRRFRALRRLPLGATAFNLAVAAFAPFNVVLGVRVDELERGLARASTRDRLLRRNHLGTVHATAMSGLAEITGNLAVSTALGQGQTFIVRAFAIDFEKKARGTLRAECRVDPARLSPGADVRLDIEIHDRAGERVARARSVVAIRERRS
jgi:uncharacterized protein (TIGR00369 family)